MDSRAIILSVVVALLSAVVGLVMHNREAEVLGARRAQAKRELARAEEMLASAEDSRNNTARSLNELREKSEEPDRLRKKTAEDLIAVRAELQALEQTLQGLRNEEASLVSRFGLARQQVIAREAGRKYPRLALIGGRVLLDAEVQKVTPTAITFKHSLGMTSATVAELPSEFVEKFLMVEAGPAASTSSTATGGVEDAPAPEKDFKDESDLITGLKRRSAEIHRLDERIASAHAEVPRLEAQIREIGKRRAPNPALVTQLENKLTSLKNTASNLELRRTGLLETLLSDIESTRIKMAKDPRTKELYGQFLDREFYLWHQRLRDSRF